MSLWLALVLALAGGPNDSPRAGVNLLADGEDDLERRLGTPPEEEEYTEGEEQSQDENRKDRPDVPRNELAGAELGVIDFDWLELQPHVGLAIFSKDYHVNPSPAFGISARAPITWLAPDSNPEGEYFGIWAQIDVAIIKRTIFPVLDKPSGPIFMMTLGLDYTIYRSENWLLMAEAGMQYCFYGGITDLENGYAPVAGLKAGFSISRSVSLCFNPQVVLGDGNSIIFGWIAATVEF